MSRQLQKVPSSLETNHLLRCGAEESARFLGDMTNVKPSRAGRNAHALESSSTFVRDLPQLGGTAAPALQQTLHWRRGPVVALIPVCAPAPQDGFPWTLRAVEGLCCRVGGWRSLTVGRCGKTWRSCAILAKATYIIHPGLSAGAWSATTQPRQGRLPSKLSDATIQSQQEAQPSVGNTTCVHAFER